MKGACVGRRAEGEAAARSRGVGGSRAVGNKAGGRWCLVQSLCDRILGFLPLTPRQEQLLQKAGGTGREEARGRRRTEALSSRCHRTPFCP